MTPRGLRRWSWVHKWSSVICTVFMLMLCITGLPLIFHDEIDGLLHQEVEAAKVPVGTPPADLDRVVASAVAAMPGQVPHFLIWDRDDPNAMLVSVGKTIDANPTDNRIVRVDAHTELAPGYTTRGVSELERTGAASLGGIMVATGKPGFQAAVARAYNSRFGLGGGAYHGESAHEGPAESAYMGIFRRDILDQVGGFDETLRRGEDWELNYRLRTAGHIVWLDPGLRVSYWPRSTPGKLARQFRATGIWRGELVRRLGRGNSLRFFAPPLLLLNLVLAVPVLVLHLTGVLNGWLGWLFALAYVGPVAYLALLVIAAVSSTGSLADRLRFSAVLAIMHLSWGAGFIVGLVRGAGDAVDTSRTES